MVYYITGVSNSQCHVVFTGMCMASIWSIRPQVWHPWSSECLYFCNPNLVDLLIILFWSQFIFIINKKLKAITINLYVLVWFKHFLEYLISWSYTKIPDLSFIYCFPNKFIWCKLDSRKGKLTPHIIFWFAGWTQRYSNCLIEQTLQSISSKKVAFTYLWIL